MSSNGIVLTSFGRCYRIGLAQAQSRFQTHYLFARTQSNSSKCFL